MSATVTSRRVTSMRSTKSSIESTSSSRLAANSIAIRSRFKDGSDGGSAGGLRSEAIILVTASAIRSMERATAMSYGESWEKEGVPENDVEAFISSAERFLREGGAGGGGGGIYGVLPISSLALTLFVGNQAFSSSNASTSDTSGEARSASSVAMLLAGSSSEGFATCVSKAIKRLDLTMSGMILLTAL